VDHTNSVDLCEGGKRKMHLEVGKGNDTANQQVDEIQSRAVKNKAKYTGVDKLEDGSSLMNWLKSTNKEVRTKKKDSEHKNLDSSSISRSYPDIVASNDMHHDFLPSVGDVGQANVPSTTSAKHGNGNAQNDKLEQNMQKMDGLCENESRNLKQRFFSNEKSTILLKRKVLSTSVVHDENIENSNIKRDMLRSDDLPQKEPEVSVQRYLAKV
jgi:gluconate kinase